MNGLLYIELLKPITSTVGLNKRRYERAVVKATRV